uniref:NADH dehydrogenase subunit 6 n=1 Tax=Paralongidorus litoralis TaxID=474435 RepID=A0A1P8C771_9BILA|nr:NADH dehydrogenase subunit 6 [Paralongidorus litoralis]AOT84252.1 NADH dehydrogenase subunit 6 [Paralongidorus litoralis]
MVTLSLVSQSGSLVSSMLIIPLSMAAMYMSISLSWSSGFMLFVYVLVFIGGLLVLLVSLTSLLSLEQSFKQPFLLELLISYVMLSALYSEPLTLHETGANMVLFFWFNSQPVLLNTIIMIFTLSLMLITWFILKVKNMSRSL